MSDNNRKKQNEQNHGAQQGNIDKERDMGDNQLSMNPDKSRLENTENNTAEDGPAGDANRMSESSTKELDDNRSSTEHVADKGDMGKKGSMQDAYAQEEGYFTMDEDEQKDERTKGDTSREGGDTV